MQNPKSILITGASSGIGEALALAYADFGISLFLGGRDHERLKNVANSCIAHGAKVSIAAIDVRNTPQMREWILGVDDQQPLDLVIANAGISRGFTRDKALSDTATEIFEINVNGVFNTIHPALERMRPRGTGQLALMSSLAGFRGLPSAAAYCSSKAAIRSYGEGLRGYLHSEGIAVSVIFPGFVRSRMTAANRYPMPFLMDAQQAASLIRAGLARNHGRIAFPKSTYAFTWWLTSLPAAWTDPLVRLFPHKR